MALNCLYLPTTRYWSVRMAERLALPTSDHGFETPLEVSVFPNLNGVSLHRSSLSCSPIIPIRLKHCWKGRKTLTHPSTTQYPTTQCKFLSTLKIGYLYSSVPPGYNVLNADAEADLGLHYLPRSQKRDARLILVNLWLWGVNVCWCVLWWLIILN